MADGLIDRVIAFLRDLPGREQTGSRSAEDPRVAAAALLYHVMDADGVRQDVEWDSIKRILADTYKVGGRELDDLVKAGEQAEQEAVDFYAFTSVLKRHLDEEQRIAFIRLLWEVVYADGVLHELEDHTLWRVADLMGVDQRDRVLARQDAARKAQGPKGTATDD